MAATSITGDRRNKFDADDDASHIRMEIEHTRHEMDETLDELGERLNFQHLMDSAMDYVRSTTARTTAEAGAKIRSAAGQVTEKIKQYPVSAAAIGVGLGSVTTRGMRASGDGLLCAAEQVTQKVRQHPISTALIGAGLVWWAMERSKANPSRRVRYRGLACDDQGRSRYGYAAGQSVPAWHGAYNWSDASENENAWTERARGALHSIKSNLSDASKSAADKIRHASSSLMSVCGHSPEQIRARMHRQWADLDEHSGSVVDARTGKPYDSSYGEEWHNLRGVQCLAECDESQSESAGWGDKASQVVDDLKQSLAGAGGNVRDTLRTMSARLGAMGNSVGDASSRLGTRTAKGAEAVWHGAADGTHRMTERAREFAGQAQESIGRGYQVSRDRFAYEADERPLAVGAAALGLGLLAGFLLPRTRTEDELMGEAADHLKDQAWDVAERGKEVVQSTGFAAMDQIKDEAKDLAQDALDRAKEVAQATGQMAMDEAKRQGLHMEATTQHSATNSGRQSEAPRHDQAGPLGSATMKSAEAQGIGASCSQPQSVAASNVKHDSSAKGPHREQNERQPLKDQPPGQKHNPSR
jgi:hypothetical protein